MTLRLRDQVTFHVTPLITKNKVQTLALESQVPSSVSCCPAHELSSVQMRWKTTCNNVGVGGTCSRDLDGVLSFMGRSSWHAALDIREVLGFVLNILLINSPCGKIQGKG